MTEESAKSGTYKVTANREQCCGYGVCAEVCPEVYGLDEDGLVVLLKTEIGEDLYETASEGAYGCPQLVLKVEKISA
ncbi:ferredoxin [Litorimonas sp.]|uniref:ferredoxin n=1 Tax=Litorimonas sp. TaxID=1892381 RepID=UPI003A86677D